MDTFIVEYPCNWILVRNNKNNEWPSNRNESQNIMQKKSQTKRGEYNVWIHLYGILEQVKLSVTRDVKWVVASAASPGMTHDLGESRSNFLRDGDIPCCDGCALAPCILLSNPSPSIYLTSAQALWKILPLIQCKLDIKIHISKI